METTAEPQHREVRAERGTKVPAYNSLLNKKAQHGEKLTSRRLTHAPQSDGVTPDKMKMWPTEKDCNIIV